MIETQAITQPGQIAVGDALVIETRTGIKIVAVAKQVIGSNDGEEIVIGLRQNHFFNVRKMLDGTSWAKNVIRIPGARMTADTNTTKTLKDYEDAL